MSREIVWTEQQFAEVDRLRMLGKSMREVAEATGRKRETIINALHRRRMRRLRGEPPTATTLGLLDPYQPHVPPQTLAERDRRQSAPPRDLTALFCGDPPKGYSALDIRSVEAPAIDSDPLDHLIFGRVSIAG